MAILAAVGTFAAADGQVPLRLQQVAEGLDIPATATTFPGNEELLVVAERGSKTVRAVYMGNGDVTFPNVLVLPDNNARVFEPANWTEFLGLTGVAFHPDFEKGKHFRYVFVRYNLKPLGGPGTGPFEVRVDRFFIPMGTTAADLTTQTIVYQHSLLLASNNDHYSGQIHFDPTPISNQGTKSYRLVIPMPDGSSGSLAGVIGSGSNACRCDGTPGNYWPQAQDPASDLGKVHVITVMSDATFTAPIQVARGLRNPYGFSVDTGDANGLGMGDVWLCDVGSAWNAGGGLAGDIHRLDAADLALACTGGGIQCPTPGGCPNFGWPCAEGDPATNLNAWSWCSTHQAFGNPPAPCNGFPGCQPMQLTDYDVPELVVGPPVGAANDALVGGVLYRGSALAGHQGHFLYAVYGGNERVESFDPNSPVNPPPVTNHSGPTQLDLAVLLNPPGVSARSIVGLSLGLDGEVYLIELNDADGIGRVHRIVP